MHDNVCHAYPVDHQANQIPSVYRLLTNAGSHGSRIFQSTVALRARYNDDTTDVCGSAFIVRSNLDEQYPGLTFYLVTALHVLREVRKKGLILEALIPATHDSSQTSEDDISIEIVDYGWYPHPSSDVSMVRFPVDALPSEHKLSSIPVDVLLSEESARSLASPSELEICAALDLGHGASSRVTRPANLIGGGVSPLGLGENNAEFLVRGYVAAGVVTKGMSGGPVACDQDRKIMGLIHGYLPKEDVSRVLNAIGKLPDDYDVQRSTEATIQESDDNSGVFIIVPASDVLDLLDRAAITVEQFRRIVPPPGKT